VTIDLPATHHGPIVLGDPKTGYALALRYTATCEANPTFRALLPMLRARSADELEAAMRPWVDPGNNFVFADVHGAIGYRTRGRVPVRNAANAWVPVPGWDGAHEWQGNIPFEEMPAMRNPATGWIATANSRIIGRDARLQRVPRSRDAEPQAPEPRPARRRGVRRRAARLGGSHGPASCPPGRDDPPRRSHAAPGWYRLAHGARARPGRGRRGPSLEARRRSRVLALGAGAHDQAGASAFERTARGRHPLEPTARRHGGRRRDGAGRGIHRGRRLHGDEHVGGALRVRPRRLGAERLGRAARSLRRSAQ